MTLIRVRLIGSGTRDDPFRAPLPNYHRLIRDDETPLGAGLPRWAIVEIADEDYEPPAAGETAVVTMNVPGVGVVIRRMDPAHRGRLLERIRKRYRERAADYDVDPI